MKKPRRRYKLFTWEKGATDTPENMDTADFQFLDVALNEAEEYIAEKRREGAVILDMDTGDWIQP